jgi:hypothetical protein
LPPVAVLVALAALKKVSGRLMHNDSHTVQRF